MCFAVDLCQGREAPVHIQISQPVNDIIGSEYLHRFTSRQWSIHFNIVSVFSQTVTRRAKKMFWNGLNMILPLDVMMDITADVDAQLIFADDDLYMQLRFSGNAALNYRGGVGLFDGQVNLIADTTINGSLQRFELSSHMSQGYCHIWVESPCETNDEDLYGISFNTSFGQQPFFSNFLRFTEITQRCSFEVFIPVDNDYRAHGLSMYTECPLLALGELIFPEMSHKMNFIGSRVPDCFAYDSLGVANPAFVIESKLINDHLLLGNILELHRNSSGGPDITTVFGQNSSDGLVSHLNSVKVALFGGVFTTGATIRNNQLTISSDGARVYGYPAMLDISTPSDQTNWDKLLFTIEGSLLQGPDSFIEYLLSVIKRKLTELADSGNARLKVARMSLNQASGRIDTIREQYNDAVSNITQADVRQVAANDDVRLVQVNLTTIEEEFNNTQDDFRNEVERLNEICTELFCEDICMPGSLCRNCSTPTFIMKTSKCPTTVKEIRTIRVAPYFVKRTIWMWMYVCRLENNQICYEDACPVGERDNCYGKCVPVVDSLIPVYHWRMVEVDVQTFENCTITVYNSSVPDTCCEEVNCAVFAPNATCVMENAMCRALRQNEANNITEESRARFQQLQAARTNLSLAQTATRSAQIQYDIAVQRRNQLQMTLERLEAANRTATEVFDRTLEEIGPLLRISENVRDDAEFQNIFKITSVSFVTNIFQSPTALDLNVIFEKQTDGDSPEEIYEQSYVYISSHDKENFERIADGIIDRAFITDSKRTASLQSRIRRQLNPGMTQREIFASRCAHISNTQLFFEEIQTKLTDVQVSIKASREGTTQLSQSLSDQGPLGDQEFEAYIELVKNYEDLSMEALRALESTIFSEWQASMEFLYSESASVGEVSCDGFADCLQTAVDELQILIGLTPETELSEYFIFLQPSFPTAVNSLLELALLSNISISDGLDRVFPIVEITNAYAMDNYWCSEPPVMISDPPPEVNISLGDTLSLSCEATSSLTVTYEWRRDGNVLPQFSSPELVITAVQRLDSANYTCFANNPVGSAESITTSVTVYELPEFYLLPESVATYYGNDNGAWFACNASAWPYPGWRWFYRNTTGQDWTLIEGEETNEFLILNPQEEYEGLYTCEAYNYHGSIRSEPVSLTLLPFTVSQQQFPLEFSVFVNASSESQSCSLDDLYDTLYSLISETIGEQTAVIEDFNITQVDVGDYDISLNLLSTNVTTRYLHLMTFAEIANLALPQVASLRRSVQLLTDLLNDDTVSHSCLGAEFSIVEDSLVVGKLTYICPPGQRLNSDYLLCLSCERGHFSSEIESSRIVNGIGLSENVPVCNVCPLETYAEDLGSTVCLSCPKYHTTLSTGTISVEDCIPQPLLLECDASSTSDHVTIDCKTNRPSQTTLCSFNNGPHHPCSYPVAINRDVSPLGNHSLTISIEDDAGFQAETMVQYSLEDDSVKPTLPAVVPPLVVSFINDSPRVLEDSVEADILISRPVRSLVCFLRRGSVTIKENCTSGRVVFSELSPAVYILRVVATNRKPDLEFIKRRFEVTNDTERCTLHLINSGVTVIDDSATVEFIGRGPAEGFRCRLDRTEPYDCSSPVVLNGLKPGIHELKILPLGCRNRMSLKPKINIV